jgi:hypothetical protein
MKNLLKIVSFLGLLLTLVPSLLVFAGNIELSTHKWLMLLGTALWFSTSPFWMNSAKEDLTD